MRTIQLRVQKLRAKDRAAINSQLEKWVSKRQWRSDVPWLADAKSKDLFALEFFSFASEAHNKNEGPLSAAGFVRIQGDESDALAVVFLMRDLSERFDLDIAVSDPDNPIAKMRNIVFRKGLLENGKPLEAILVARPIYKRLPNATVELYPPQALNFAYGRKGPFEPATADRRWSFSVYGIRGTAESFFEAEAEAMRIYHGMRFTH